MATAAASAPAAPRGTLVCASVTARSPQEMAAEVAATAALGADVAELQVGCLDGFQPRRDLPVLLAQPRPLPIVVAYSCTGRNGKEANMKAKMKRGLRRFCWQWSWELNTWILNLRLPTNF